MTSGLKLVWSKLKIENGLKYFQLGFSRIALCISAVQKAIEAEGGIFALRKKPEIIGEHEGEADKGR